MKSGGTVYGVPQLVPILNSCYRPICSMASPNGLKICSSLSAAPWLGGIVLCVANPFGPRQRLDATLGVVPVFLGKALRNESLQIWGDGSTIRDFFDVRMS